MAKLAGAALSNAAQQAPKIAQAQPATLRAITGLVYRVADDGKRQLTLPQGLQPAPRTPFNVGVTNRRTFTARSLSLADIKATARRSGARLNDIVLAVCAGALKRHLDDSNVQLDRPLVAGVPISLREAGNTDLNPPVSMMVVNLCTDIDDPLERLKAITASANVGKKLTGSFQGGHSERLPFARRALADVGRIGVVRPLASGRAAAAHHQCSDLERARSAVAAAVRRGEAGRLLSGLDSGSRRGLEHDGAEPQRRSRSQPDGVPPCDRRSDRSGRPGDA